MSISISDIEARVITKMGTIPPSVEAKLHLVSSTAVASIPATTPGERADFVRRKIIDRLYGDIGHDFEAFLLAIERSGLEAEETVELREQIRAKLLGNALDKHAAISASSITASQIG